LRTRITRASPKSVKPSNLPPQFRHSSPRLRNHIAISSRSSEFTASLERLYVLHAFQKKSKKGIGTPGAEIDLIRARLRWAVELEHGRI
jgi:hypothetical protein